MKATINTYKTNATLFFNGNAYDINWDGMTFDDIDEWNEWASDELEPADEATNRFDIRERLYIATQHLINDDMVRYIIDYTDGSGSGCRDRRVHRQERRSRDACAGGGRQRHGRCRGAGGGGRADERRRAGAGDGEDICG